MKGFCPGCFCPGVFCPGVFCPGGFCPLSNLVTSDVKLSKVLICSWFCSTLHAFLGISSNSVTLSLYKLPYI